MNAQDLPITQLLDGAKQFIVPIFQRDYSWGTRQCQQLWNDILRVGSDERAKGHFLGSVVYVSAEETTAGITRWLLIDGQQRLTTLVLLLFALRQHLNNSEETSGTGNGGESFPTPEEIDDYYLRNRHGKGERRYKLHLRRADQETLTALLDGKDLLENASERIQENYTYLKELVTSSNVRAVYKGIKKLVIVDVSLARGQDDPQMIFESLNSTGIDLTQADLIRNYVLMRLDETTQTRLYEYFWQPIEAAFGVRYRTDFDKFVKDFLTLKLRPGTPLKSDEIYREFQKYFLDATGSLTTELILDEMKRFGGYYVAFSLGKVKQPELKEVFVRLRKLVEVASPVVMTLYDYYDRTKSLTLTEFVEAIELLESFVFRRSVCDLQTRSLGQIFSGLAYRIREDSPLQSLKVALSRQGKKNRFPSNAEFRESLESRDIYDMRNCFYLLDSIENFSREKIDTSNFSIEHVLPQNEELRPEWRVMLGSGWKQIQETWLHKLGNLTLTGYNSAYSDLPFDEKKTTAGGFNDSPLRLNRFIREREKWTEKEIEERGKQLSGKALSVWKPLEVNDLAVKQAELNDKIALAAKYSLEDLGMDTVARRLFVSLRDKISGLGQNVIELFNQKSVTYRVYDYFVEVIPRRHRLTLLLNLDFEESEDASGKAKDATESAFVMYACERGGVLFNFGNEDDIGPAMIVIRQAYERVAE